MQKLYRTNYEGEFVVDGFTVQGGTRTENRVFIPNTIVNNAHTTNAIVIGNGISRAKLNLKKIENHSGGHLGKHRLQSYGCNAVYRDMSPDFLISTNNFMVTELVNSGYTKDHVVLSNATNCRMHAGELHLIPYGINISAGAMATYMACFDGHKKIYLLGFDNHNGINNNNIYAGTKNYQDSSYPARSQKWEGQMTRLFNTYDDVDFVWIVGGTTIFPEEWKYCLNLRQASQRDLVLEADL
jgi:hypothetical protein